MWKTRRRQNIRGRRLRIFFRVQLRRQVAVDVSGRATFRARWNVVGDGGQLEVAGSAVRSCWVHHSNSGAGLEHHVQVVQSQTY